MLNETLGKITFVLFFIGFHLTFFIQHFLGLMGMPRRVWTYLPNQGFDTPNLVSSIGAGLMGIAVFILLFNIIASTAKGERVGNDPWGDGRTIEWAVSSPAPYYNFKQTPLIRGLDAYWLEKMEGRNELTPAEPIGDIHMPNSSILPFFIAFGLFVASFGVMYHADSPLGIPVLFIGLAITFGSMLIRSVKDDHGYHIHKEELLEDSEKGVKA